MGALTGTSWARCLACAPLPGPGSAHPVEVESQHHAPVEQRLIAYRAARQQVLDGLLVNVGGVGEFGLRHLLLDHRRLDERERSRMPAVVGHVPLLPRTAPERKRS